MNSNDSQPFEPGTLKSKINHLYAKAEAQTYRIGKNTESLEKIDKRLDRLAELLAEYNVSLEKHIARSNALEKIVDQHKTDISGLPVRVLQLISIAGGLVALIKAII